MKNNLKKGFTLVELVIVIAVIAILSAVLIPTFSNLVNKANISADTQLVKNLNTALSVSNKKHVTMYDALKDAKEEGGMDVAKINASATHNEILWDSVNDVFCYLNDGDIEYTPKTVADGDELPANDYRLWRIASSVDSSSPYSTYLYEYDGNGTITTTKGIDCGDCTVTSITYNGASSAQDVIIRTNSDETILTINAEKDTVNHYGEAKSINIVKVNTASYHEFGTVPFIQISEGRVVLEETADVNGIHVANVQTIDANGDINKTDNTFSSKVTLELNGADVKLSRDNIGTAIGETAVLVCEVKEDASSDEFIWLKATGTIEQENVYVTTTNTTPTESNKVTTANASDNVKAIANNATNTGTADNPVYTVAEGGKSADEAQKTSALKGLGTEENPFIISCKEDFESINNLYTVGYYYYEIDANSESWTYINSVPHMDGSNWSVYNTAYGLRTTYNLNGSFEGNGLVIDNLSAWLFDKVGYQNNSLKSCINNLTLNCKVNASSTTGAAAVFRSLGCTNIELNNINVHGTICGSGAHCASFFAYGTANAFEAADYIATFNNCHSDATIIDETVSQIGSIVGHIYASGHKVTLNLNNTDYTGYHSFGTGKDVNSSGYYYDQDDTNGKLSIYINGVKLESIDNKYTTKVTQFSTVTPVKENNSYKINVSEGVSYINIVIRGQLDFYSDGKVVQDQNGITLAFDLETLSSGLTSGSDIQVLEFSSFKFNDSEHQFTGVENGVLYVWAPDFTRGNISLQVSQYNSNNGLVASGGIQIVTSTEEQNPTWTIK